MSSKDSKGTDDLVQQFRELGQQLEKAIRKAWESDQGQEFRDQVGKGLKELNTQLGKVADDARKSDVGQNVAKKVKGTVDSVKGDQTAQTALKDLGEALRSLNDELNKLIRSVPGGKSSSSEDTKNK